MAKLWWCEHLGGLGPPFICKTCRHTALRRVINMLEQPGELEICAVFKPHGPEDAFVLTENGNFGLRLTRPETGDTDILAFADIKAMLDEVEELRQAGASSIG